MRKLQTGIILLLLASCIGLFGVANQVRAADPCCVEIVEKESGWPVPMIQLRTTNEIRYVSDNAGRIAIDDPELMNREVFFHVEGHGYEVQPDGFGIRGVRLTPHPGRTLRVEVNRSIIARRLARLTGAGLFAESQKLGREMPDDFSGGESGLVGCDSVQTALYRGRRFWVWGDTSLFHYPLGIFHASGATTPAGPLERFEPPMAIAFDYFRDPTGRPRGVAKMPGKGPTWLTGLVALPDRGGTERLVASYVKIDPPLDARIWGLCVWDDAKVSFEPLKVIWEKSEATPSPPVLPRGHTAFRTGADGQREVFFGNPFPTLRCEATFEAWQDPAQWQSLDPQQTLSSESGPIKPHTGSIAWNAYRNRWVTVFMQRFGKPSAFGELWYAEADAPTGPWGSAVKILSHDNYTFYNPRLHSGLVPEGYPVLLFEGTYTKQFADNPTPTPRYDYNQILYRLDLDDPRLRSARASD